MPAKPPFAEGRDWDRGMSRAPKYVNRRVWHDRKTKHEYEPDPNPRKSTWHEIDPQTSRYREIDPVTGEPVSGREGEWRALR
jgi:hypothetical protein